MLFCGFLEVVFAMFRLGAEQILQVVAGSGNMVRCYLHLSRCVMGWVCLNGWQRHHWSRYIFALSMVQLEPASPSRAFVQMTWFRAVYSCIGQNRNMWGWRCLTLVSGLKNIGFPLISMGSCLPRGQDAQKPWMSRSFMMA